MMDNEKYHPLPQPEEVGIREKEDAMGAYLMMFAALGAGLPLPVINLIASIIYYYLNKSKSRFVMFHALQSLLSQIPLSLLNSVGVIWAIRIIFWELSYNQYFKGYISMIIVANLIYIIFSIIGAIRARKGRFYYFLFFGKIAYQNAYSIRQTIDPEIVNKPPE